MYTEKDTSQFLQIAEEACRIGMASLRVSQENFEVLSQNGKDIKLSADINSEKEILTFLKSKTSFEIISEEKINSTLGEDNYVWIVDPLDGTMNFSRGIPFFGVSIGLWKGQKPVLAALGDVRHNSITSGIVGIGAKCDQQDIKVSKVSDIAQSILATGFPVSTDLSNESMQRLMKDIQRFKKIRMFGSAALSLSFVAQGKIEAYREENILLWDVAAGIALVLAAGGKVNITFKESFKCDVFASNGFI